LKLENQSLLQNSIPLRELALQITTQEAGSGDYKEEKIHLKNDY